jgi:phospho-N-acetylmuramoyl-pentapeptide-transferase
MQESIILNVPALIRVFWLTFLSFVIAFLWTPVLTDILYKYRIWKKVKKEGAPIYNKLHAKKENTPVMGGLLIWVTALVITLIFNFSRSQTWLPLFALVTTAILGFVDDYINVRGIGKFKGLRARHKILWLLIISSIGAWWFYSKLGWGVTQGIHIPGIGDFLIGWWYIPLFIFVIIAAANAVNLTDGLDGLAGGLLAMSFLAYGIIAFVQEQFGIAAFCGILMGAILAFLWFNIYPARFFMGDTGSISLGATLGVVAMLTNSVIVLPIIGSVFLFETLSVIVQQIHKKVTGRKLILSAPIHNHFQALGWPETKVTARFWIIGMISAIIGLAIALIGRG